MGILLAGHYELLYPLGEGGFGATFVAKDIHLPDHSLCVVKQLKPKFNDAAALKTAKRLFERETATLYRLGHHDRIPRLLAHFQEDEEFYLVQEYIEGQPLNQEITRGSHWHEVQVIEFLFDILNTLIFVHEQNVIHRDIKPANLIRRSQDSKIVLIDFGAVKEISCQSLSQVGEVNTTIAIGSPGYMPSEQQTLKPSLSSDIYAVGVVALQALTGIPPTQFPRDHHGELSCAVMPNLPAISPGLALVLDKMVRYDYRQRYQNARETLQALETVLDILEQPTIPLTSERFLDSKSTEASVSENTPTLILSTANPPPSNPSDSSATASRISQNFQTRCRQELANYIGPFADFILEEILLKNPTISSQELAHKLAQEIPDPLQAEEFLKTLKPDLYR